MRDGYEIGEFEEDGAFDELCALIDWLVQRLDSATQAKGFCGVDVSGARANIALLATIISNHKGSGGVPRAKVEAWAQRIDETFTEESKWGFTPWPEDIKQEWRDGCRQTTTRLLTLIDDEEYL